jgi:hypothetical protein
MAEIGSTTLMRRLEPLVSTTASPVKIICVPSVQRMGVRLPREISQPLSAPPTRPVTSATATKPSV